MGSPQGKRFRLKNILAIPPKNNHNTGMTIEYLCTHCGHRFNSEKTEYIECPKCYWTSSVKRAEQAELKTDPVLPELEPKKTRPAFPFIFRGLIFFAVILCAGGVIFWGYSAFRSDKMNRHQFSIQPGETVTDQDSGTAALEASVLWSEIAEAIEPIPEIRNPGEEELAILRGSVSLQTGMVEKIPSPVWTLEGYKGLLAERQKFYQVSLPRSYLKKLYALFESKYLPAEVAFQNGRLPEARDLWVDSLAFPVYQNNIQKHRGVVLTMLKPFINDTLSKIGAVNQSLASGQTRQEEEKIIGLYGEFNRQIHKGEWSKAGEAVQPVLDAIREFERRASAGSEVPPYPPSIRAVDADIRHVLTDQARAGGESRADFSELERSLKKKQNVLNGLSPEFLARTKESFEEVKRFILEGQYQHAREILTAFDWPYFFEKQAQQMMMELDKATASQKGNGTANSN